MAHIRIYRSADRGLINPLCRMVFVDTNGNPYVFDGHRLYSAVKPDPLAYEIDPTDATSPVNHHISFDAAGNVVSQAGFYQIGPGLIEQRFTATETLLLPTDVIYKTDIRVVYPNGEEDIIEVHDTLEAINPITNMRP